MKIYLFILFILNLNSFAQKPFCIDWNESEFDSIGNVGKTIIKTKRFCYDKDGNTVKKYFYATNFEDPGKEKTIVFDQLGLDSLYFITKPNGDYINSFYTRNRYGDVVLFKIIEKNRYKNDTTVFAFENNYNKDSTIKVSTMHLLGDTVPLNSITYQFDTNRRIIKKTTEIFIDKERRLSEIEINKYDDLGRLLEKSVTEHINRNSQTWAYIYIDKFLFKERYFNNNVLIYDITYIYVEDKMKNAVRIDYASKRKRFIEFEDVN